MDRVMYMRKIMTVTRKGQATLPAAIRRKLGLTNSGGVLEIRFNEKKREAVISRPVAIRDLSQRISRHIRPGTKPLLDVDAYYQKHRQAKTDESE